MMAESYDQMLAQAESDACASFASACIRALRLAPDTMREYGVTLQRAQCLEELDELASVIVDRINFKINRTRERMRK